LNPQIQNVIVEYQSFIFDGVILDSNKIKSEAFAQLAQPYGKSAVDALTTFHLENGEISRFEKVRFLVGDVLGQPEDVALVQQLVIQYGLIVREQLMDCAMCDRVVEFLEAIASSGKAMHVVSGAPESELCDVFKSGSIVKDFSSICGSPRNKSGIEREIEAGGALPLPGIFGDSHTDYEAAIAAGRDCILLHILSEMADWKEFIRTAGIAVLESFVEIMRVLRRRGKPNELLSFAGN